MLGRLLIGLVLGLLVGGLIAAGLVLGLGVLTFSGTGGAILAYVAAALTGVLTGLVAGKPIWSSGAKIEAGLKAVFGALIGAGAMFALRRWGGALTVPSLPAIGANGMATVGDLPAISLPLLAAVLGGFFGVDNTGNHEGADVGTKSGSAAQERRRVAVGGAQRDDQAKEGAGAESRDRSARRGGQEPDEEAELVSGGRTKH